MELTLTFDIEDIKKDLSDDGDFDMSDFWNAHSINWEDSENPTTNELKDSIKSEIECWLEDLGLRFGMKEITKLYRNPKIQLADVLWEFINEKDIDAIQQRLKEVK